MKYRLAVGLASVVLASAGCSANASGTPHDEPVLDFAEMIEPTWTVGARLVGNVVAADGVVVSYLRGEDGALQLGAWDARNGEELWREPASTGQVTQGITIQANLVEVGQETYAAYLRPADNGWQEVALTEVGSGAHVETEDAVVWATSRPDECSTADGACFTGFVTGEPGEVEGSFKLEALTGRVVADGDLAMPANARMLGSHVYATDGRPPNGTERIGYTAGGLVKWEADYESLFGEGFSSDVAWAWSDDGALPVAIGSGYWKSPDFATDRWERPLASSRTVAVDPETGKTLWSLDGTSQCYYEVTESGQLPGNVVPLCRFNAGVQTITAVEAGEDRSWDSKTEGADVDVIGVEASTGQVLWEVPLGGDDWNSATSSTDFATATKNVLVTREGETILLDLATGDTTSVPKDGVFACYAEREFLMAVPPGGAESVPYATGSDAVACDYDGAETGSAFSSGGVRSLAVDAGGGFFVLDTAEGLQGYRLSRG